MKQEITNVDQISDLINQGMELYTLAFVWPAYDEFAECVRVPIMSETVYAMWEATQNQKTFYPIRLFYQYGKDTASGKIFFDLESAT